jgi:hypothetical protein
LPFYLLFDYLFNLVEIAPPIITKDQGAIAEVNIAAIHYTTILFSTLADLYLLNGCCSRLTTPGLIKDGVA